MPLSVARQGPPLKLLGITPLISIQFCLLT